MDCHFLLQEISLTQGSNLSLYVFCTARWVLYWSWLEKFRLDILKVTFLGGVEPEVKYSFAAMGANATIWCLLFLLNTPENMHTFSPGKKRTSLQILCCFEFFLNGEFNSGYITDISKWASLLAQSAFNAGDTGSIPGWGRSPGEGNGNPLQYSCLENPMGRGTWLLTSLSRD